MSPPPTPPLGTGELDRDGGRDDEPPADAAAPGGGGVEARRAIYLTASRWR